jgi:hypothetical protein
VIDNAIKIVDRNKKCLGKTKNMSSLEKNRIALNILTNIKEKDEDYIHEKNDAVERNMKF